MERAKNVRWALAMGYDRQELAALLTDGLAWPSYVSFFNPKMPQWEDRWKVDYDPARARQMIKNAGYPNGFAIEIFGQSDRQIRAEVAKAVAGFWQEQIGLRVTVQSYEYGVFRPSIVSREANIPFVVFSANASVPRPWDWPVAEELTSLTRGRFSFSIEIPFVAQSFLKASKEPDLQERLAINDEVADYLHEWMIAPSSFTIPELLVYNPKKVESWEMRLSLSGPITAPENIVLAK